MEENFIMRMSTDDRELLDKLSEFLGESKSTVVRMSLREQAQRYGFWPQFTPIAIQAEENEQVPA